MKDLWLIVDCRNYYNEIIYIPIFANSKAEVGYYIKNNIEKFYNIFVNLHDYNKDFGEVRERLYDKKNEVYYNLRNDKDGKTDFLNYVKNILNEFDNEELIDELYGFSEEWRGDYLTISQIKNSTFIEI